jgi:predicted metal-binding protein
MSLPLEAANDLMKPVISELNEELLETEKSLGGMCYGFVGTCPYCGDAACARIDSKPCRHPDKVRPSLEAIGFDISKTSKDLLGLDIKWSQDGLIPEYLTLVCGIFYKKH